MPLSLNEINALVSLLDDDDQEVFQLVSNQLGSLGVDGIPVLEAAWEHIGEPIIQEKIEDIIQKIQFDNLKDLLNIWIKSGGENLLDGVILVAKFQYPELDESKIINQIDKIIQSVWIELNNGLTPLEEVRVINHVFFNLLAFHGDLEHPFEPNNGYINLVLDSKKGNSLILGIIYSLVAKQLNIPIYGVNLPYHFILAYSPIDLAQNELGEIDIQEKILFYINPLNKGLVFSRAEISSYLERSNIKSQEKYFNPSSNLEIVKALIHNQMNGYDQKGQKEKGKKWQVLYKLFD